MQQPEIVLGGNRHRIPFPAFVPALAMAIVVPEVPRATHNPQLPHLRVLLLKLNSRSPAHHNRLVDGIPGVRRPIE